MSNEQLITDYLKQLEKQRSQFGDVYIYELVDTTNNITGYIGQTRNMNKRLWEHHDEAKSIFRMRGYRRDSSVPIMLNRIEWLAFVIEKDFKLQMRLLEHGPKSREEFWIREKLLQGCLLTNDSLLPRDIPRFDAYITPCPYGIKNGWKF